MTGLVAVAIALRACRAVDTYGMSVMQHADPEFLGNATPYDESNETAAATHRRALRLGGQPIIYAQQTLVPRNANKLDGCIIYLTPCNAKPRLQYIMVSRGCFRACLRR